MKSKKPILAALGCIVVLGILLLGLTLSPIRVQVDGWQLEVVRLRGNGAVPTTTGRSPATSGPPTERSRAVPTQTLAVSGQNRYIVTDQSWKFSRAPAAGWEGADYDDSGWSFVDSIGLCYDLPGMQANCIWDLPYRYVEGDTLFMRKVFDLREVPPRARMVTVADDDVDIYLGGRLVLHDESDNISIFETDVTGFLQPGPNALVLRGVDTGEGAAIVQSALGLCYDQQDRYSPQVMLMDHREDWFNGRVYIEAADAPCDSGIAEVAYQVDAGEWRTVELHQLFQLPTGEHDVQARATDGAGKQSFDTWHFRVNSPSTPDDDASGSGQTASAFAGPILAAIADRPPHFQDDFSDPQSGWVISTQEGQAHAGELGYQDGEYFIVAPPLSPQEQWRHGYLTLPAPIMHDFVLELDVRFMLTKKSDWGPAFFYLHFRVDADSNYSLALNPQGMANLSKNGNGQPSIYLAQSSNAPIKPVGTNQVRILAKGSQIALFLNGQPLFMVQDDSSTQGNFILGVANSSDLPQRVQIDNIRIWNITSLP